MERTQSRPNAGWLSGSARIANAEVNFLPSFLKSPQVRHLPLGELCAGSILAGGSMNEHHYSVQELSAIWRLSAGTVRKLFKNELGVLKVQGEGVFYGKRQYVTCRIPESVAKRVYARLKQDPIKAKVFSKPVKKIVSATEFKRRVA